MAFYLLFPVDGKEGERGTVRASKRASACSVDQNTRGEATAARHGGNSEQRSSQRVLYLERPVPHCFSKPLSSLLPLLFR